MAKRFFFICGGLLCLALAYHLGAQSAAAQSGTGHIKDIRPSNDPKGDVFYVVTDADDIYAVSRSTAASEAHGTGWVRYRLGILR
jgi:hypothetical protein